MSSTRTQTKTENVQPKSQEVEKKTTNWVLIGGLAVAGVIGLTAAVVVYNGRSATSRSLGDADDFDTLAEDSRGFANFITNTKATFTYLWHKTSRAVYEVDRLVRTNLGFETKHLPLVSSEQAEKKADLATDDEISFIEGF